VLLADNDDSDSDYQDNDDSEGSDEDEEEDDKDTEPPEKRIKLGEMENEEEKVESKPSEISSVSASDKKSTESISPQSHRRKKISVDKDECAADADVEKWANAIIKYHQQTQDLRIRYVTCTLSSLRTFCKDIPKMF